MGPDRSRSIHTDSNDPTFTETQRRKRNIELRRNRTAPREEIYFPFLNWGEGWAQLPLEVLRRCQTCAFYAVPFIFSAL